MRSSLPAKIALVALTTLVLGLVTGSVSQVYADPPHHGYYRYRYHYYYWYFGGHWFSCYRYYYYPYSYPYYYSYSYPNYYSYYNQYQLTVNTDPTSLSTQVNGGGSYTQGSSVSFSIRQNIVQVSWNTRYVFSHWGGDYSGTGLGGTITMDRSKTITAIYQLQYYCSITSNALSPQGTGWYNEGDTLSLTVPIQVGGNDGRRFVFDKWVIDGESSQTSTALTLQMNTPHTVVAQYKQQFYLKVATDQGVPSGEGWYDANTDARISVSTPESPSYGVKIVFNGWQGDVQYTGQSTKVLMDRPKTVTATWRTDSTVLYQTILIIILAVVLVAVSIGAYVLSSRREKAATTGESENEASAESGTTEPAYVQPSRNVSQGTSSRRKYCGECGKQIPRTSKFCLECGAKLP